MPDIKRALEKVKMGKASKPPPKRTPGKHTEIIDANNKHAGKAVTNVKKMPSKAATRGGKHHA